MIGVLEKVVARQQQRRKSAETGWRKIVVEIADGKEPKPEEIERLLDDSGKTIDNLREDVSKFAERRQLAAAIKAGDGITSEQAKLEQTVAEAAAVLAKAQEAYDAVVV